MKKVFAFFFAITGLIHAQKGSTANGNKTFWQYANYALDSTAGISLPDFSNKKLDLREKKGIVIALIDSDCDIEHEYIKNWIWTNRQEIPGNGLDDDDNGYIDDIHGWNYLATETQKLVKYANNTSIRFVRENKSKYINLLSSTDSLSIYEKDFIDTYNYASKKIEEEKEALNEYKSFISWFEQTKPQSDSLLNTYGFQEPYNLSSIDSLFNEVYYDGNDELRGRLIFFALDDLKNNRKKSYENSLKHYELNSNYATNENFLEKELRLKHNLFGLPGQYGSGKVNINAENETHATEMAGTLVRTITKVFSNVDDIPTKVEIMILSIFPESGAEYDEDLTSAIHYAVDNGADIINYSSVLNFLVKPEKVYNALQYAQKSDVLFVAAAGNEGYNLDEVTVHPNNNSESRILTNFIRVGATGKKLGLNLKPKWASYGSSGVDLFAPGTDFFTSIPGNKYHTTSGSSISTSIVSGIATCIKLLYPNHSSEKLKQIIMDSVSKYSGEVSLDEEGEIVRDFDELSTSGGILNVKQAFKLAEQQ